MAQDGRSSGGGKRFRWTARVLGTLVAAFWLFAGIASAVEETTP